MSEFMWKNLYDAITKNNEAMLLTIFEKRGSAPRGVGTSMLVLPDSTIYGTIGGGPVENQLIEDAVQYLRDKKSGILEKVFSGDSAICGGRIKVILEYYSKNNTEFLDKILKKYDNGEDFYIVRNLKSIDRKIVDKNKIAEWEKEEFFLQKIKANPELLIFGGGHIAVPLVKMAKLCDFNVTVFDDRPEFAERNRFPEAKNIILCNFNNILSKATFNNNTFIVLVTREHAHDEILLKQILGKKYAYLGMIGSKNRVNAVKNRLKKAGFNVSEIERIYSPIGLNINSETPAEIAVSIIAEIIKVKNG